MALIIPPPPGAQPGATSALPGGLDQQLWEHETSWLLG